MGTTMERNEGGGLRQSSGPTHDTLGEDQRVHLHEMPDLTKEAPEVTYGQPKRSWLRYLAAGVTVGAVAVGAGLVISTLGDGDVAPQFGSDYSMAREHLAQVPGGFPFIQPNGTTWSEMERSLEMEHIARIPGGFPSATGSTMRGNEGPVNDAPGSRIWGSQGPVNDGPASTMRGNEGPVNDAPGSRIWGNQGPVNDAPAA